MNIVDRMKKEFDEKFPIDSDSRTAVMPIRNIIVLTEHLRKFWETRSGDNSYKQFQELSRLRRNMFTFIDILFKNPDNYIIAFIYVYKSENFPNDIKKYDTSKIKEHDDMTDEIKEKVKNLHKNLDAFSKIMGIAEKHQNIISRA